MDSERKARARIGIWISLFLIVMVLLIGALTAGNGSDEGVSLYYLEDPTGNMSIREVLSRDAGGSFSAEDDNTLSIGQSRSTWWIRLELAPPDSLAGERYLTINNPTVEKAVLYLPALASDGSAYMRLQAGWGFRGDTQDEGFNYPVFRLPDDLDGSSPVYLELQSPYTQNYPIGLLSARDMNRARNLNILVSGLFFGLLLAMGINNFINFLMLKDRVHLHYVVYMLSMIIYQASLLGTWRLVLGAFAESLVSHVITIGILMVANVILFFRSFLSTSTRFSGMDKIAKLLLILCPVVLAMMLVGWRYEASILSTLIGTASGILVVVTSLMAVWKGVRQAKFFLAGWCAMLVSLIIFTARVWGLIPNSNATLFIVMLSASIEAIFLSAALADRMRVMREERASALQLYKNAEASSISNESAFLQAQIRPHFLYNTLNVIAALCRMDAEKARELVLDLSSYLRHSFDFRNLSRYVTLEEEMEFIQAYVKIEQARFRDKLKVVFELEDTGDLVLPPLMLEPLVENAIRHGIRKSEGSGTVIIRVLKSQDGYVFEVEDDGIGMHEEQIHKIMAETGTDGGGVGLANIRRRLTMLYGTKLIIESRPGGGTKVAFRLPADKGGAG